MSPNKSTWEDLDVENDWQYEEGPLWPFVLIAVSGAIVGTVVGLIVGAVLW